MEDILSKLNDSVPSAKARSRSVLPGPGRWKKRDKGGVYIVDVDLVNRRNVENRSSALIRQVQLRITVECIKHWVRLQSNCSDKNQ